MTQITVDYETISYGKDGRNKLVIRGLSTADITFIAKRNMEQLEKLFDLFENGLGEQADPKVFGMELMEQFPDLVAQIIALAADSPDQAGECAKLPGPVQLKAVIAVYDLTIEDTGGLNDFLAQAVAVMDRMKTPTP